MVQNRHYGKRVTFKVRLPEAIAEMANSQSLSSATTQCLDDIAFLSASQDILSMQQKNLFPGRKLSPPLDTYAERFQRLRTSIEMVYQTDEYERAIEPAIQSFYKQVGSPDLYPGTVGAYIYGCFSLSEKQEQELFINKLLTPLCATSIRPKSKNGGDDHLLACVKKVIWTDQNQLPLTIIGRLVPDAHLKSHQAVDFQTSSAVDVAEGDGDFINVSDTTMASLYEQKLISHTYVYVPHTGPLEKAKTGLPVDALDRMAHMGISEIQLIARSYDNRYSEILPMMNLQKIPVVKFITYDRALLSSTRRASEGQSQPSELKRTLVATPPPAVPEIATTSSTSNESEELPKQHRRGDSNSNKSERSAPTTPEPTTTTAAGNKSMMPWLIGGSLFAASIAAGLYYFRKSTATTVTTTAATPRASASDRRPSAPASQR